MKKLILFNMIACMLVSSSLIGSVEAKNTYRPKSGHTYISGPRGGCYYINSNKNKTYVDRALCK